MNSVNIAHNLSSRDRFRATSSGHGFTGPNGSKHHRFAVWGIRLPDGTFHPEPKSEDDP